MFLFQLWQTLLFGWSSQVDAQAAYAKFWVGSGLLYAGSAAFKSATTYCTSRCLTLSVFVLSSTATWSRTSSQLMLQKLVRGKKQTRERALQWRRWDTGWIRTDWIKWATDFNRFHSISLHISHYNTYFRSSSLFLSHYLQHVNEIL